MRMREKYERKEQQIENIKYNAEMSQMHSRVATQIINEQVHKRKLELA